MQARLDDAVNRKRPMSNTMYGRLVAANQRLRLQRLHSPIPQSPVNPAREAALQASAPSGQPVRSDAGAPTRGRGRHTQATGSPPPATYQRPPLYPGEHQGAPPPWEPAWFMPTPVPPARPYENASLEELLARAVHGSGDEHNADTPLPPTAVEDSAEVASRGRGRPSRGRTTRRTATKRARGGSSSATTPRRSTRRRTMSTTPGAGRSAREPAGAGMWSVQPGAAFDNGAPPEPENPGAGAGGDAGAGARAVMAAAAVMRATHPAASTGEAALGVAATHAGASFARGLGDPALWLPTEGGVPADHAALFGHLVGDHPYHRYPPHHHQQPQTPQLGLVSPGSAMEQLMLPGPALPPEVYVPQLAVAGAMPPPGAGALQGAPLQHSPLQQPVPHVPDVHQLHLAQQRQLLQQQQHLLWQQQQFMQMQQLPGSQQDAHYHLMLQHHQQRYMQAQRLEMQDLKQRLQQRLQRQQQQRAQQHLQRLQQQQQQQQQRAQQQQKQPQQPQPQPQKQQALRHPQLPSPQARHQLWHTSPGMPPPGHHTWQHVNPRITPASGNPPRRRATRGHASAAAAPAAAPAAAAPAVPAAAAAAAAAAPAPTPAPARASAGATGRAASSRVTRSVRTRRHGLRSRPHPAAAAPRSATRARAPMPPPTRLQDLLKRVLDDDLSDTDDEPPARAAAPTVPHTHRRNLPWIATAITSSPSTHGASPSSSRPLHANESKRASPIDVTAARTLANISSSGGPTRWPAAFSGRADAGSGTSSSSTWTPSS